MWAVVFFLSWSMSELKFCFNIWKTAKQTIKILEIVYRTEALSHVSLRILEKGT